MYYIRLFWGYYWDFGFFLEFLFLFGKGSAFWGGRGVIVWDFGYFCYCLENCLEEFECFCEFGGDLGGDSLWFNLEITLEFGILKEWYELFC